MIPFVLTDLFLEQHLVLELQGAKAGAAIWEIVERMGESGDLGEPDKFYEQVMEREQKSSTVANGGVAFPHARTNLVSEILLGIGRSKTGVTFVGRDNPVHLLFVIAVPQQMVNDYLICVGALARLLKSETRRADLLAASTATEFFDRLRSEN